MGDIRRWASAADTAVEHISEADARSNAANAEVLYRWPTGPWLTEAGTVWPGDESRMDLEAQIFELTNEVDRCGRRIVLLRDALAGIGCVGGGPPSGRWSAREARAALAADDEVAEELTRLAEAVTALTLDEIGGGDRE